MSDTNARLVRAAHPVHALRAQASDRQSARHARDPAVEPELIPGTAAADERLLWIGEYDRGVELEIVALVPEDMWLVIHVMPTTYRERGR